MIGVVRTSISNVVEDLFSVHSVSFSDREQSNRSESSFGVDVETLSFSSFHLDGELWYSAISSGEKMDRETRD